MKAVVVASDMITPYGKGIDACWQGLLAGRSAISRVSRFTTSAFHSDYAGIISGLRYHEQTSLVMQMLQSLFEGIVVPEDAKLLLATTKGEIDLLEQSMLENKGDVADAVVSRLISEGGRPDQCEGRRAGAFGSLHVISSGSSTCSCHGPERPCGLRACGCLRQRYGVHFFRVLIAHGVGQTACTAL